MDRGLVHKSSPLVGEMGEAGHGWWSVNNLRPPFEQQHHPSLFMPSTTTAATTAVPSSSSSSPLHSFSSLLLSNHYPLPTTSTSPWHHDSSSTSRHGQQGLSQQDSWSQLIQGGLATNGEEKYKEGQMLFPTSICSEAGGSGSYLYSAAATASHGSSTSDEIQLPWGSAQQQHKALQQKASSSPRSSSMTSTTSLGSNMLEFSNNSSSPRECISTASGSAFKKARTQEPSPTQSTTVKVRKEKLGDRITALHQLVSPFGKTDTASVLLEAIGYIRFLHGQIEALSSPYVGGSNGGGGAGSISSSSSSKHHQQQQLHEASVSAAGASTVAHGYSSLPLLSLSPALNSFDSTHSAHICVYLPWSYAVPCMPVACAIPEAGWSQPAIGVCSALHLAGAGSSSLP